MRLLSGIKRDGSWRKTRQQTPDDETAAAMDEGRIAFMLDAEGEGVHSTVRAASAFP